MKLDYEEPGEKALLLLLHFHAAWNNQAAALHLIYEFTRP